MVTRKRNEWLDAEESDEEERGYGSEEESRAQLLPGAKRRKVSSGTGSGSEDSEAEAEASQGEEIPSEDEVEDISKVKHSIPSISTPANLPTTRFDESSRRPGKLKIKPDKPRKDRSGIIYLSRVPPFMKPSVLRSLLTPYGAIGRIFCTPESSTNRSSRLKSGGTRRKLFLDGWVEFLSKKDAKTVAEMLNAQIIGGKKRSKWHDEVWNIRYLRGVKWSHLVEQIQNENAERAARMRAEIAQNTRENKRFLENIERGKMIAGIEAKRKEKLADGLDDVELDQVNVRRAEKADNGPRRTFKQREIQLKGKKPTEDTDLTRKVISSIF